MDPTPDPTKALLAKIREAKAEFGGRVEELRAEGFEVGEFLEDCERLTAVLENRSAEPFDVKAFIARLCALVDETNAAKDLHEEAEKVKVMSSLPGILEEVEEQVAMLRGHGGKMEARTAADLEASVAHIREELAAGRMDADAVMDMKLTTDAQLAELSRRNSFRSAKCGLWWEKWPPERWAKLSPEERLKLEDMLADWRREREKILGSLPIEDRRRLEALRYEDFDKPGACEP